MPHRVVELKEKIKRRRRNLKMNKKVLASLVMAGVLTVGVVAGTYAWYKAQVTSSANNITAGILDFDLDLNNNGKFSKTFELPIKTLNIEPGDILTKDANGEGLTTIRIKNFGNINMAYFGRFTVALDDKNKEDSERFAKDIKIVDYNVRYYKADGKQYDTTLHGNYPGEDRFITNGELDSKALNIGMSTNIYDWANGNGPCDIMNTGAGWDAEGLKPGEYMDITFKLQYDKAAELQGQKVTLGYEVKATQAKEGAVKELMNELVPEFVYTDSIWSMIKGQTN